MAASITHTASHLSSVTGIDCHYLSLLDETPGEIPLGVGPDHTAGGCVICDSHLSGYPAPSAADPTHRFAAYQAERLGGKYIYFCSYALLHIASPVIHQDELVGALICGPGVLGIPDDINIRALKSRRPGSLISGDALVAWIESLPHYAPDEATSLSDIVLRVACSFCDREAAEFMLGQPEVTDQSDISRYLHHLRSMEGDKSSALAYPVEKERELTELVAAGEREAAVKVLDEILLIVMDPSVQDREEVRSRVLELVVLLSRAAIAGGADVEQVFGMQYRYLIRVRSLESIDQIASWLTRILRRFIDLVFDLRHLRFSGHLSRAIRYIHSAFREPITLADTADHVGLSAGYLSRIFNGEIRTTFSAYLTRIRVQEARRLLRRSSLPVGDVGSQSGFSDRSYFAKVFRQQVGLSPKAYRNRYSVG